MSDDTTPPEPDTADWAKLKAAYDAAETAETEASEKVVAANQACKDADIAAAAAANDYIAATDKKLELADALESYRSNWERINLL